MKKVLSIALVAIAFVFTSQIQAQNFSGLDKSPLDMTAFPASYKESKKDVRVTYGRPQLKGREIADLAPNGKVWRTGANEAPEVTFYKDATIGGTAVKAGTYALLTIPGDKEWTIILNNNVNEWGSYTYNKDEDVARVQAKVSTGKESLEAFSMAFVEADNGAQLVMGWGTTRVTVPIQF